MTNHALIVAYSDYIHLNKVPGVVSTANSMKAIISHRCDGSDRLVFDNIEGPLIDKTKDIVETKLDEICRGMEPSDRVALILIGHGDYDESKGLRIATKEADPNRDVSTHWLEVSELANKLDRSKAREKLLLLDCCRAGFDGLHDTAAVGGATLDDASNNDKFASKLGSNKVQESLSGGEGRVARIWSASNNEKAWLSKPLPQVTEKYPSLIQLALNSSPFLRQDDQPEAIVDQTYFCQAVAVSHYISSNATKLLGNRLGELTDDERRLVKEVEAIVSPRQIDGFFFAEDLTKAAAYILKELSLDQTPRFAPPKRGESRVALSLVSGKPRGVRLTELKTAIKGYQFVGAKNKSDVIEIIEDLIATPPRNMLPRMTSIEKALEKYVPGMEFVVVEDVLEHKYKTELYANIASVREETEDFYAERIKELQDELVRLKEKIIKKEDEIDEKKSRIKSMGTQLTCAVVAALAFLVWAFWLMTR